MYRIVPVIASGYIALQTLASGDSAVSPEAEVIHNAANRVAQKAEQSVALFGEKAAALSQLTEMAAGCSAAGWDGQDAAAVGQYALSLAERFVRALPEDVPLPEFSPEPDGSISLDWMHSSNRRMSVSVGRGNRLAYAWLDGTEKSHGVAIFDGRNIPQRILSDIKAIIGEMHAGLRAA
jgi:hypothetical protein